MNKYNCTVIFDASVNVIVEADTPEDAAEQAENEAQGRQNLCHQCANALDTGDSIGVLVYNDECSEELLDTRYKPQRTWVGLTENEKADVLIGPDGRVMDYADVVDVVESKLKEKNT
jgi:hypothetical protein